MRVLQAMAGARYGGAEAFFTRLTLALDRAGLDQRVVIRRDGDRAQRLRAGGIEPVEIGFGGAIDIASRMAFRRQINDYKPDIVLTWMNRATDFCPKGNFIHAGRLGGYYKLKYYRKCDHLVVNTEDIGDYLTANGWAPEKVHYLPNFVASGKSPAVSRSALYTPASVTVVLGLGRLHENKGFDVLLEAISRVPNVYLWLAGEGPLRAELTEMAEKLGIKPRVRFLGWRDDTEALFAAADIFVCPSRHEPLGNVIIEAWAQHVPVLATDSLGPGTLIKQGVTGILSPVDDGTALARNLKHLVDDQELRRQLADQGRAAYEKQFTEESVIAAYMDFFKRLAG